MACTIPNFVDNIPTIPPLDPFDIVCETVFPPPVNIPDIPCGGMFGMTSDITVIDKYGDESTSSAITIAQEDCGWKLEGNIDLSIPCPDGYTMTVGTIDVTTSDTEENSATFTLSDSECSPELTGSINVLIPAISATTSAADGGDGTKTPTCNLTIAEARENIEDALSTTEVLGDTLVTFNNGATYHLTTPASPIADKDVYGFNVVVGTTSKAMFAIATELPCETCKPFYITEPNIGKGNNDVCDVCGGFIKNNLGGSWGDYIWVPDYDFIISTATAGNNIIYLECVKTNASDTEIASATVEATAGITLPADTTTTLHVAIATFVYSGGKIASIENFLGTHLEYRYTGGINYIAKL